MKYLIKKILFVLLMLLSLGVQSHSGKAKYHVIIDTDGGLDDLRSITLLLAAKEVEVIGIHCSDGILAPQQTALKVR